MAQVVFNKLVYAQDSVNDYGITIINYKNEGFIAAGSKLNILNSQSISLLLKLDMMGDTVWKREYNFNLSAGDIIRGLELDIDGNIITCGITQDTTGLKSDAMLLKVDTFGNTLWMKRYGGLSGNESGYGVKNTKDSGFIFTGWTTTNTPNGYEDVFLIKTDTAGNIDWQKQYGGSNSDLIYSIDFTNSSGYILFGTTYSFGAGQEDYYLIKTDSLGNMIWQKTYGGLLTDYGLKAITTLDGGYIMAGAARQSVSDKDGMVIKTDSAGNIQWQKYYSLGLYDEIVGIRQFSDSTYAFVGSVRDTNLNNTWTGWVIMAKPNGDTIWTKQFLPDPVFSNNSKNNYFYAMDISADKGIVACGAAALYSPIGISNDYDVWVVRIDSLGCAEISCLQTGIIELNPDNDLSAFKVYPNPNDGNFTINYTLPQNKSGMMEIYDVMGKIVLRQTLPQWSTMQRVNLKTLTGGIYVVKVYADGSFAGAVRVVKE